MPCIKTLRYVILRAILGWTGWGLNPSGSEIFCTHPDRPWGLSSLLYNGYRVIPGVKWPGRGVHHPPQYSVEVKERVELYLYSPSGPSLHVLGWNSFFTCHLNGNTGTTVQ